VQRALERLEPSEHRRRLYKIHMLMQDFWETVARGPDNALSAFNVLVNMISLDIQQSVGRNLWRQDLVCSRYLASLRQGQLGHEW